VVGYTHVFSHRKTTSKRTLMKMLHIVCGKKFESEIVAMFKDLGLKGYTVISGVGGSGVTGTVPASDSSSSHGTNTLFLVALGYEAAFLPKIVASLKELRARHIQGHDDREIPLKVFLQPCEIII
jgi:3-phosphoglycerate kinase